MRAAKPIAPRRRSWCGVTSVIAAGLLGACKPDLGEPVSLIREVTILAVRSEPPEAAPGDVVHLSALVAAPEGSAPAVAVTWSDCLTPKPPVENNFVSSTCVTQPDDPGKVGQELDDKVPPQACTFFGPVAPPVQPPVRPRDPDTSGGFYFPVRAAVRGDDGSSSGASERLAFGAVRLARSCGLPYAAPQDRTAFAAAYVPNANPVSAGLAGAVAGAEAMPWPAGAADGDLPVIPSGAVVALAQAWTAESAETYPVYDVPSARLVTQREAISVAWFTTAGTLAHDRTGRAADDEATSTENTWTAPVLDAETRVSFWIVLRDSRGGVTFASHSVRVVPR